MRNPEQGKNTVKKVDEAPYTIILSDPWRPWKANWYKHWVADDSEEMVADNYVHRHPL